MNLASFFGIVLRLPLVFTCSFAISPGYCQQIHLTHRLYDTRDGMNSQEAYSALEDRNGLMWFGTDAGVSRFNGYEFKNFSTRDGLVNSTVFDIYEDPFGKIWFLGFGTDLCYFYNDSIYPYPHNDKLKEICADRGWVSSLYMDENETLYVNFALWGRAIIDKDGNSIPFESVVPGSKEHLSFLPNGEKVIVYSVRRNDGTKGDLYYKWGDNNPMYLGDFGYFTDIYTFILDAESVVFSGEGLRIYIKEDFFFIKNNPERITASAFDSEGRLWIGIQDKGINIYEKPEDFYLDNPPTIRCFEEYNVSEIHMFGEQAAWLSVENKGVCYIPNYHINNYFSGSSKNAEVSSSCVNDSGDYFYATDYGNIFKVDSTGEIQCILSSDAHITQISYQEPYTILFSHFTNPEITRNSIQNNYQFAHIPGRRFLYTDSALWQVSSQAISKIVADTIQYETTEFSYYKAIYEDGRGTIWVGGNDGLFRYNGTALVNENQILNDASVKINCISGIGNDLLFLGTKNHGLIILLRKKDQTFDRFVIPLYSDYIKDIVIDDENEMWLATNHGIIRLAFEKNGRYHLERINHLNGLFSDNVNDINCTGNHIYAGTNAGLTVFDKRKEMAPPNIPPIYFSGLKVNQKTVPVPTHDLSFDYRQNYFEFSYTGVSYQNAGNVTYKYKLEGLDSSWHYTKDRNVRYPSLSPGEYTFFVTASNDGRKWSETKSIRFKIAPPFWYRWWFICIVIISCVALIFTISRARYKRKLQESEKKRLLEEEKRKVIEARLIALHSQMNPHFTFNALNAIQNVMISFSMEEAIEYMANFSTLMRCVLENTEKLYIQMKDEIELLLLYIRLENLRFNNTVNVQFETTDTIKQSEEMIPSMIIQPFIENAFIHGLASLTDRTKQLTIKIEEDESYFYCSIEDNGIGREEAKKIRKRKGIHHHPMGINNIKKRLALFGQRRGEVVKFKLTDCYNKQQQPCGTRIEIRLKKEMYESK